MKKSSDIYFIIFLPESEIILFKMFKMLVVIAFYGIIFLFSFYARRFLKYSQIHLIIGFQQNFLHFCKGAYIFLKLKRNGKIPI